MRRELWDSIEKLSKEINELKFAFQNEYKFTEEECLEWQNKSDSIKRKLEDVSMSAWDYMQDEKL